MRGRSPAYNGKFRGALRLSARTMTMLIEGALTGILVYI